MSPPPVAQLAVPAAAFVSWAGMFVHNLAELPGQSLLSPESLLPLLGTALLVGWFTPGRRAAAIALLAWGLLHLIGGGVISVLPLPFLPFVPEQTLSHYLFHGVYSLAQLPLIFSTVRWLRVHSRTGQRQTSGDTP